MPTLPELMQVSSDDGHLSLWLPGDSEARISFYGTETAYLRAKQRLATINESSFSYTGLPATYQVTNTAYYQWQIDAVIMVHEYLKLEDLITQADQLLLSEPQQYLILHDEYNYTNITLNPEYANSIVDATKTQIMDDGIYAFCAHNVVITSYSTDATLTSLKSIVNCQLTLREIKQL